jgi:hypothetical protein
MKKCFFFFLVVLSIYNCNNNCKISPFTTDEIIEFRKTQGENSKFQVGKYDIIGVDPVLFIRYLASVGAFSELDELRVDAYSEDRIFYNPYFIPSSIPKKWINDEERKQLMKLICSKQPAIPTMNKRASSLPYELSTVGIEAMHLIHYSLGNEAAFFK